MTVQDFMPAYQTPDYVAYQVVKGEDAPPAVAPHPVVPTTPTQWAVRVLMLISFGAMILMNSLTGPKNASVSNAFPTRITPANYAFFIWFPLFVGIGAFVGYAFINRGPTNPLPAHLVAAFVVNMLCNAAWGYVFTHEYGLLSLIVIMGTLSSCIAMYIFVFPRGNSAFPVKKSVLYWCRQSVWSAYTAWEVVATLVNIEWCQQFYKILIGEKEQNIEAVAIVVLAVLIGAYWALARSDILALAVLLWSFVAIIMKQKELYPTVVVSCVAGSIAVIGLAVVVVVRQVVNSRRV